MTYLNSVLLIAFPFFQSLLSWTLRTICISIILYTCSSAHRVNTRWNHWVKGHTCSYLGIFHSGVIDVWVSFIAHISSSKVRCLSVPLTAVSSGYSHISCASLLRLRLFPLSYSLRKQLCGVGTWSMQSPGKSPLLEIWNFTVLDQPTGGFSLFLIMWAGTPNIS